MKLLLDTHALLWSIIEPDQLSPVARAAITDPAAQVAVSAISFWEIAIKTALGKLALQGATPETLVDAHSSKASTCCRSTRAWRQVSPGCRSIRSTVTHSIACWSGRPFHLATRWLAGTGRLLADNTPG